MATSPLPPPSSPLLNLPLANTVWPSAAAGNPISCQWFTDQMLFHYRRCRRRVYLDSYGDPSLKDPPSDYFTKLRDDSAEHRRTVMAQFAPLARPNYPQGDWKAAAEATWALMTAGTEAIAHAVLLLPGPGGVIYRTEPDLLIKHRGHSRLGDWHYVPYNVKLGKRPKPEYQLVATFHAYVLAELQGVWPETAHLFLKEKGYAVDLARYVPKLEAALDDCLQGDSGLLYEACAPEVFISRSRCDMCPWLSACYQEAKAKNHLSLLPGVTVTRYPLLVDMGITTVEALAQAQPEHLADSLEIDEPVTEKMIYQAQANWTGNAIARLQRGQFPLTPADVPSHEVELYFDIEAAPDKDLIYLHGVLVVEHLKQSETFHALVAESPEEEAHAWFEFLALVYRYPAAPVYHFCPYEAQTVRRLGEQYGTQGIDIEHLLARFVDIHKRVVDAVALPVESYALKHLARWIGFDWRDEDANGAQSICWYDDWLRTGDRSYLDTILRYNEDDCLATYRIKDWLVNFAQPFWQSSRPS